MSKVTPEYSDRTLEDGSTELSMVVEGVHENDRVSTLQDLLDAFEVDSEEFEVTHFKPNSWETTFGIKDKDGATKGVYRAINYQAKATLKRNQSRLTTERVAEIFQALTEAHSPKYKAIKRKPNKNAFEATTVMVDLFDLHIGMLAWGEETLGGDWDSAIGVGMALRAVEDLLERTRHMNVKEFIFPMGNDLLHTDTTIGGSGGATTAGTPQDVDSRYLKMFRTAMSLMVALIDLLRQTAPVKVIVVPGNHDRERAAYMGEAVNAWYRNDPEVEVDNSASLRKYAMVDNTLMGFTHGDGEKPENLPLIMAQEMPKEWGEAEFKVFYTGHLHRKRKMLTVTTDTYTGVEVLTLPSLVPAESWHAYKGFVGGGRAAEAYLIGERSGPCGYFRHNVYRTDG